MAEPLTYMPLRYRLNEPAWPTAAFLSLLTAIAVGAGLKLNCNHAFEILLMVLCGLFVVLSIALYALKIAAECRIEGGTLSFRSAFQSQLTHVQVADLDRIFDVHIRLRDSEQHWCELVFRDRRRARVNSGPMIRLAQSTLGYKKQHEKFALAMQQVNPAITFDKRDGRFCHACGKLMKPLHFPESACSECGERKPLPLTPAWGDAIP